MTKKSPISSRYMRERWENYLSQDDRGILTIEGIPVDKILTKYGTPLYVLVESEVRSRFRRFKKVFGDRIGLQYSVKTNSNLEILQIARQEGFDIDCSSVGELILGLLADFKPKQLILTNLVKSEQDVHFAAKIGVQWITADSLEDVALIAKTARKLKKHIRVMLRVNPMLTVGSYTTRGNKYGIPINIIDEAVDLARKSPFVDLQGFHFMGGYVYQTRLFKSAARTFLKLIKHCQDRGVFIKSLSLGGGFPAAIGDQKAFPIEDMRDFPRWFEALREREGVAPLRLIFEPGKSIVMNACMGLMRVYAQKKLGNKRMIIVDGSTYNFVPDALVQSDLNYDVLPASRMNAPRKHHVTIAGNTCDCWDLIARDIDMPKVEPGDIIAIMDVGGYAQVLANNFNTIKRAAMVMIHSDGTLKLIRRRDRYSEMFAPELDVLKVAAPNELELYHNLYRVNIDKIWKGAQTKARKNGNGNGNGNGHG